MNRIEQIAKTVYKGKIQWECEFDEAKIAENKTELLTHSSVQHSPLKTRDAIRFRYETDENETIEYCYVISLYPYICKYFKFPLGHPTVHVGDTFRNVDACL